MGDSAAEPVIRADGVRKLYGKHLALDDLTFALDAGAVGLLGPNGSGKSTLIKILLGLLKLNAGEASVLGFDTRRQARRIREVVGYMPEDDCLIAGLKGVEMVAYAGELAGLPPRASLRRAHEILDFVLLGEERYREVDGYSTGMRQKIKLAQALVHSPRLLFLDEPTSGLDPRGRAMMLELIRSLWTDRGVSVVISTHILQDIETSCDTVLILGRGRLLVHDSLASLQRTREGTVEVHFDGDAAALQGALERSGHVVMDDDAPGVLRVRAADEAGAAPLGDAVFRAAVESGAAIRQIVRSQNSLERIFLQAVQASESGTEVRAET